MSANDCLSSFLNFVLGKEEWVGGYTIATMDSFYHDSVEIIISTSLIELLLVLLLLVHDKQQQQLFVTHMYFVHFFSRVSTVKNRFTVKSLHCCCE